MTDLTSAASGENIAKLLWIAVVLAFMVERALAVVFEHRLWLHLSERFRLKGLKEIAAVALSYYVCACFDFDALALLFNRSACGYSLFLTALIIAGGSKGAIKLMQDVLGVKRPVEKAPKPRKR